MPEPAALLERRRIQADPMLPRPFRVVDRHPETPDTITLTLEAADGLPGIHFLPAQFGMIGVPGVGEVPISFSSDSTDQRTVAVTIRTVGAVTTALTSADRGRLVTVRGPFGTAWPLEIAHNRRLVFVAGGLGLAPLRAAVLEAIRHRHELVAATLAYGVREPGELLFQDDLQRWVVDPAMSVLLTVDRPFESWTGHVGLVTTILETALVDPPNTVVMVCGPDAMMRVVGGHLVAQGTPPGRIWLTMERNMKCGIGLCGHCQFGPYFVCTRGPVFSFDQIGSHMGVEEL